MYDVVPSRGHRYAGAAFARDRARHFGGGGGGKSSSTTEASYPPEFRPLADSARTQIQDLQAALPLAQFATFQPAGTAGVSPLQQFAIEEMIPRTLYAPPGMDGLLELPSVVNAAARGASRSAAPTSGSEDAMAYLRTLIGGHGAPGGVGGGGGFGYGASTPLPTLPTIPSPTRNASTSPATVFPGLTHEAIEAARPGIAAGNTPSVTAPFVLPPPAAVKGPAAVPQELAAIIAERAAEDAAALDMLGRLGVVPPEGVRPSVFLKQYMAADAPWRGVAGVGTG